VVESKKVVEKFENQRLKVKKLLKNLKTVKSKKVAEKSLNQRLRAKKLLKNL
jgi:hypothetical protein